MASDLTEHKVHTEPTISVIDGYVAVNGVKTEYEVNTADVITVEDGYVVVNGVKTEHKVHTTDVIEVDENGYLIVNGVKTEYMVTKDCVHIWETITTPATCAAGGYDTITCKLCDKSVTANETAKLDHTYSTTYSYDDNYHWFKCQNCDAITEKALHTPNNDDICTVCQLPTAATPGIVYDVSADGTYAEVIAYNGTATKVRIADTYNGLPVTTIYQETFQNNKSITNVVIPDSVTTIGDYAFYSCSNLTSVTIGDSVTTIGTSAFSGCSNLTSVTIPDSVTTIGHSAFWCCSNLTSVTIPDSVTTIGAYAFEHCYNLASVTIGDSVTTIGREAFYDCSNLTSVTIGDSVTTIGGQAFDNCDNLTSVTIGDSVTAIGYYAFYGCSNLTDVYYTGSEADWAKITIGSNNSYLTGANRHYNYVPEE